MGQYFIVIFGSAGDAHPMIRIGAALCERGHRVTVISHHVFADMAISNGMRFVALGSGESYAQSLRDKIILNTRYRDLFNIRHSVGWNSVTFRTVREAFRCEGREKIKILAVDRPNMWADLLLRRHLGATVVRFVIDLPLIPEKVDWFTEGASGRVQRLLASRFRESWSRMASELGISAGHEHLLRLFRNQRRFVPTFALWPSALVSTDSRLAGLSASGFVLPAQNEELVDPCVSPVDGSVRIVWVLGTAGTTRGWSCRAAEICRSVCEALQCSGVLVGGDDDERRRFTERFGSGRVIWVEFCPLRALLRRADVVVHHGGIGTSALALEAAVPQVIVPRIFMQPMNAEWLQRMGLCTVIAEREINTSRCIDVLKALFSDPEVRSRAQLLASAEGFRADLSRICDELDRHE